MTPEEVAVLGDLATWISAIGTLGAFIVAFKQIHTERHERKRREVKEKLHAEQEQARHISVWIDDKQHLILSNTSHHPVHNVRIKLTDGSTIERHTVEPGKTVITLETTSRTSDTHIKDFIFTDTLTATVWRKVPGKQLEKKEQAA